MKTRTFGRIASGIVSFAIIWMHAQSTSCEARVMATNQTSGLVISSKPANTAQEDVRGLTERVLQLEIDVMKNSKPGHSAEISTAIIAGSTALLATLLGGWLTSRGQKIAARHHLELARQQAIFQHLEKLLEFRLKQMENFYAPMFAQLQQSTALYRKLGLQLAKDDPHHYKFVDQSKDFHLQVKAKDGNWHRFRLLDRLPAIRSNQKAMALVASIIEVGERTSKLISKHAGLASADLVEHLGDYLAHFALLSAIYRGTETEPYEPNWHKIGYFSDELHKRVEAGYSELSKFIDEYGEAGKRVMAKFDVKQG